MFAFCTLFYVQNFFVKKNKSLKLPLITSFIILLLRSVNASTSSELYPGYFRLLYFSVKFLPWALRFSVGIFYAQAFFALCSLLTIDTTCFYQGFPGSRQFFFEGCRFSHWGSKHRPGLLVCLNLTMFSKTYSR